MKKVKWGIIGLGNIAKKFADTVDRMDNVILEAVASRSKERSESFGLSYGISKNKCYGNYTDLVQDKSIDVIYIAVPNVFHKELSILCLSNKKAVLCEKPVAMSGIEIKEVIDAAKANKVFFMEAMKTRFLPINKFVKEVIQRGDIGEVKLLQADFGFKASFDPNSRLFQKEFGGGSLLDVGIYNVSYSSFLFGNKPTKVQSSLNIGVSKVDECASVNLTYENNVQAQLYSSIVADTIRNANIIGTEGRIIVPRFSNADTAYVIKDNIEQKYHIPFEINGFEYQINEVVQCINEGKLQSDIMSWNDSIEIMEIIDKIK